MQRQTFREETAPSPVAAAPRYDAESVREVLARASEIEAAQHEPDALTAEQVETLGAELGLSPAAVRRALGEREHKASPAVLTVPSISARRERLTVAQIVAVPLPGLVYAIALSVCLFTLARFLNGAILTTAATAFILFSVFFLPPLLSGWLGWRRGDVRLGLATGFACPALTMLALIVGAGLQSGKWATPDARSALIIGSSIVAGTFLGWFGAFLRERYEQEQTERAR